MKKVITEARIPIKLWLDDLEAMAKTQAENLANLPFAYKHIAIMPDSHVGYGMPIGSVLATQGVIIPNAVGVDIGCGMGALRTSIKELSFEALSDIYGLIVKSVPVGYEWHEFARAEALMPGFNGKPKPPVIDEQYDKARYQLGTLGGGNHFIEIQKGDDGYIWIMIHSGSRNLGKQVADHYHKVAAQLNGKYYSSVPIAHQLAFLPIGTSSATNYIKEMDYCIAFAMNNREIMLERVKEAFRKVIKEEVQFGNYINKPHNFAAWEHHFSKNVVVHRKGACEAKKGVLGMIPGSQGTNSYIVEGKGEPESFGSCSHGAGRRMGRKQACKDLNLKEEQKKLKGIIHSVATTKDLDEAPGAYKNIKEVMDNQKDLVDIIVKLTPLAVIKG